MMIKALANEPLPIYGDGQNIRDWLYVEDHVRGIITALEKGRCGQTYNIGGQSEKTNLEVVQTLCDILDHQLPRPDSQSYQELISFVADRPGHDRRYAIDSRKINQELGWYPAETFESGLKKTVTWYLNHQSWWRLILDKKYQGERLGLTQDKNSMEKGASVL
jgi:dTDP-glucose 4,6-dehydratase